jgi:hypothetical protein
MGDYIPNNMKTEIAKQIIDTLRGNEIPLFSSDDYGFDRIANLIGRGSFGDVYHGTLKAAVRDVDRNVVDYTHTTVAVKTFVINQTKKEDVDKMVKKLTDLLASEMAPRQFQLQHPNVVKVGFIISF